VAVVAIKPSMENVLEKACALSAWDRIALNRLKIAVRCFWALFPNHRKNMLLFEHTLVIILAEGAKRFRRAVQSG